MFTIPCSIASLTIDHALCDLGAIINLMSLSMMKKLNYGEPKPTQMTLTLEDCSITYPYGVLEYVMVMVDDLLFPTDLEILNMHEDAETPLLFGRPFLAIDEALVDVDLEELFLRFNKENFKVMRHHK